MAERYELNAGERAIIEGASESPWYAQSPVPAELVAQFAPRLLDFASLPRFQRSRLAAVYGAGVDVEAALEADWEAARACGALYLFRADTVSFALHVAMENGNALTASIKPSGRAGEKPWYVAYAPDVSKIRLARDAAPEPAAVPAQTQEPAPIPPVQPAAARQSAAPADDALPPLAEDALLALGATAAYTAHPVETDLLADFADGAAFSELAVVGTGLCARIIGAAGGAVADAAACRRLLDRDWAFARAHGIVRTYEDEDGGGKKILFPISVMRTDGATPVEVGFWRNRNHRAEQAGSLAWYAYFLMDFVPRQPAAASLFDWAYLGPVETFLAELADAALPEPWGFGHEAAEEPNLGILRNYIIYTFYRLSRQEPCGVLENEQAGIAAFNTGLVDETYEPIYAVFSANERESAQPWYFQAFCRAGSSGNGGWGTRLSQAFSALPPRAHYVERAEDLLFDTARELDINYDHILLENIERLPKEFLIEEVPRASRDVAAKIDEAFAATGDEAEARFAELRAMIEADRKIQRRLMNRLEDAIELARRRVEWNFRTAVPSYYPTADSMSLLLPLDLTEDGTSDVALVVELASSGRYLAKTILTMRMAYQNARLVCRPESDWLAVSGL